MQAGPRLIQLSELVDCLTPRALDEVLIVHAYRSQNAGRVPDIRSPASGPQARPRGGQSWSPPRAFVGSVVPDLPGRSIQRGIRQRENGSEISCDALQSVYNGWRMAKS